MRREDRVTGATSLRRKASPLRSRDLSGSRRAGPGQAHRDVADEDLVALRELVQALMEREVGIESAERASTLRALAGIARA